MRKMTRGQELRECLQALSSLCDGANQRDGAGFNKMDSQMGHHYAGVDQKLWGEDVEKRIYNLLRKYRKQLAGIDIDFDRLPYWSLANKGGSW